LFLSIFLTFSPPSSPHTHERSPFSFSHLLA
jgi:hypothetical protein